jgi:hypothetical protein
VVQTNVFILYEILSKGSIKKWLRIIHSKKITFKWDHLPNLFKPFMGMAIEALCNIFLNVSSIIDGSKWRGQILHSKKLGFVMQLFHASSICTTISLLLKKFTSCTHKLQSIFTTSTNLIFVRFTNISMEHWRHYVAQCSLRIKILQITQHKWVGILTKLCYIAIVQCWF